MKLTRKKFYTAACVSVIGIVVIIGIWYLTYTLFAPSGKEVISTPSAGASANNDSHGSSAKDLDDASSNLDKIKIEDSDSASLDKEAEDF